MTCPSPSRLLRSTSALGRAAFTLSEILIALAVLGTMSAGAYIGFNAVNAYSVSSRLYSEAQAICQNQIDMILSKGPFDLRTNRVPAVLALGTTTTPNVFVYRDPVSGNVVVTGTMITTITDAGLQMTYAGDTTPLNVRRAKVTVAYSLRNTPYTVTMETMRTTDL
jgi:prepilin-type N-terminal cleavage/methylation domain-containing protein